MSSSREYSRREEEHAKSATTGGTGTTGMGTTGMGTTGMGTTGTGTTGMGTTGTGEGVGQKMSRKAGEAWEGVKEAVPGTAEHRATHPTSATGMGTGMHGGTTGTGTTMHSERTTGI